MARSNGHGAFACAALGAVLALQLAACSTITKVEPVQNERRGLIDRLARLQPAALGSRPDRPIDETRDGDVEDAHASAQDWVWPLKHVQVTSEFGKRDGRYHEGIDLRAAKGTPVYAVAAGKVVFAGKMSGYGRLVVIKHPSGLFSVYAHHSVIKVKRGQSVKQGQEIALSGASGRASGPHLHFEVRKGVAAVDPLRVLPARGGGTVALFR